MKVSEAIELMVNHYGDLNAFAQGLPVDASELYAATFEEDTAEAVAAAILKKYVAPPAKTVKEK